MRAVLCGIRASSGSDICHNIHYAYFLIPPNGQPEPGNQPLPDPTGHSFRCAEYIPTNNATTTAM